MQPKAWFGEQFTVLVTDQGDLSKATINQTLVNCLKCDLCM